MTKPADTPVRCTLADIDQHSFVLVDATIINVGISYNPCTIILADNTRREIRVQVYPTTFAMATGFLFDGYDVLVSAYTAEDAEGVYLVAYTICGSESGA